MTLWTDLFHDRHMISRAKYNVPGTSTITAPANAAFAVFSASGAGSWKTGGWGHGAAFARTKLAVTGGAQFQIQIGDIAHTLDAVNALGDTIVTRVSDSSVQLKAQGGQQTGPGLAANSTGSDVTRDGSASPGNQGGASAGDDGDFIPLGFGGPGATPFSQSSAQVNPGAPAYPGAGGGKNVQIFPGYTETWTLPAGGGVLIVEWYDQDPGALH